MRVLTPSTAIDYLVELQEEHKNLRERLVHAQAALGLPFAPQPGEPVPAWEREWTGGSVEDDESDESE
jgi:hypothetical protein